MKDLAGKVAFITGGASGIGLELARACATEGMKLMLADIDQVALDTVVAEFKAQGTEAAGVICDVSDVESLRAAANATIEQFGKVHLLANNAGVLVTGGAGETSLDTWRWAMDVNVMGVVYGVEVFLPLIRAHGEGGHILNTASVGGHAGFSGVLAYCTTKHAVVGYTDSLAAQLADENIGVSALCPGFVNTRIAETERYDENSNAAGDMDKGFVGAVESGMSPEVVGQFAIEQVKQGALFIFTHPGTRGEVEERFPRVSAAFDVTEASALINSDPDAKRIADKKDVGDLYS